MVQRSKPKKRFSRFLTASRAVLGVVIVYFSTWAWLFRLLHQRKLRQSTLTEELDQRITLNEELSPSNISQGSQTLVEKVADTRKSSWESYSSQVEKAERLSEKHGSDMFRRVLTAYTEAPMRDTIPGTGNRGDLRDKSNAGTPPEFVIPLPLRTQTPADLQAWQYPAVKTCHDLPAKLPVDRGLQVDASGNPVVWNVGSKPTPPDFPQQEAPFCPVELDPFLPWIHDVFYAGGKVHFIAQNKRRCRTGTNYTRDVDRLVPQVALMQSVSVQTLSESQARELAPTLWHPDGDVDAGPRYRLAPFDEADANFTRFICRFHVTEIAEDDQTVSSTYVGETLSEYPFNYEYISYRKNKNALLTPKGMDSAWFWTSSTLFNCPLPEKIHLTSIPTLSDGTPLFHVDLVPIRTSARFQEMHLPEAMIGPKSEVPIFDARQRWGPTNVLPHVLASGRWENIPICPLHQRSPEFVGLQTEELSASRQLSQRKPLKPHFLSACLWASAEFKTRGVTRGKADDTSARLREWIQFHLMVGFDQIYLYDNSGAHSNETSLEWAATMFPGKVTYINWPHAVCNNNIPAHDSPGERSSQYAAENSCRSRYASTTEWIAAFDTDEYLVPTGNFTNLKDMLREADRKGTKILSFRSSRGYLRLDASFEFKAGLVKRPNATFLEAYNCDSGGIPKPSWANRARKQIYQADYVLYHFVHYSTVTRGMLKTYEEAGAGQWNRKYGEHPPIERVTDESNEAVMIHTKTISNDMTKNYKETCRYDYPKKWKGCYVANPWPSGPKPAKPYDKNGTAFNCFINEKVEYYWLPKLRKRLEKP